MLAELFVEGIMLACESFQMCTLETRLTDVEDTVTTLNHQTRCLSAELRDVREAINRQANFRIASLRESSMRLLGKLGLATSLNADVLSYFVASMGSLITAVTFKGRRKPRDNFQFGLNIYRGFMASTQTPERIFQTLSRFQDLAELTGGRIETGAVVTKADMKATAVAIAAFFKIAAMFGVKTCALTDDASSLKPWVNVGLARGRGGGGLKLETGGGVGGNGASKLEAKTFEILIRFEGRYSIRAYERLLQTRTDRIEIIRSNRRNVYILGPNGAGKSSWGNLISGEETFEVGCSNHTTMIPQPCDVEAAYGFRLWDTPGLFDGSEEQGLMEDYMNHVINVNGYCSGVVFVFSGIVPANEGTLKILRYAIERFGEHVKRNFLMIINDFYGQGGRYKATYSEMLYALGFQEDGTNVIVSDALESPNKDCVTIRARLSTARARLVANHATAYRAVIEGSGSGDLRTAVRNLYEHGKRELLDLLKRGRIETVRYCSSGPRRNTSIPKDVLLFKQHSSSLLLRKLRLKPDRIVEERSVQLKGSAYFLTLIRAQLNQEYTIGEVNIFLKHILGNERYMLIHTPKSEYDYELRDATRMSNEELQDLVVSHLIDEMKVSIS